MCLPPPHNPPVDLPRQGHLSRVAQLLVMRLPAFTLNRMKRQGKCGTRPRGAACYLSSIMGATYLEYGRAYRWSTVPGLKG